MLDSIRILFLADTHLGFDLPMRPRVRRRRRGHDFQANYEAALGAALTEEVDLVVHGGDLFHRPSVSPSLAWQGLAPLVRVAEAGVPVVLVPGNHERSRIPHERFGRHRGVHVFDRPGIVRIEVRGRRVALVGFPFARAVRRRFPALLRRAGWRPGGVGARVEGGGPGRGVREAVGADVSLLCLHQCVEGATVGPSDFTFTTGDDVIGAGDLPAGFAAVLSGHIHRHQALTRDLRGAPLPAPVLYPGSVERTSLAEKDEVKGYLTVEVAPVRDPGRGRSGGAGDPAGSRPGGATGQPAVSWRFHPLPARPMVVRDLELDGLDVADLELRLRRLVSEAPADAVLRIRTRGAAADARARRVLAASNVRRLAPAEMNIEVRDGDAGWTVRRRPGDRRRRRRPDGGPPTLGL